MIKGRKVLAWTADFSMPFRVSNTLYLTSPQIRYIIQDDNQNNHLAILINNSIPETVFHEYNPQQIKNINNYKVRFAYFDASPHSDDLVNLQRMPDRDVTAVEILSGGNVYFYRKDGSSWLQISTSFWVTHDNIMGAVIAEDAEMYNCQLKDLFRRLAITSEVYLKKTESLQSYFANVLYGPQKHCSAYYGVAVPYIKSLISQADYLSNNFPGSLTNIDTSSTNFKTENRNLILKSCPHIY